MPELPDIMVYVERSEAQLGGRVLRRLRILSPFLRRRRCFPRSLDPGLWRPALKRWRRLAGR
jgi:hypothetical protein